MSQQAFKTIDVAKLQIEGAWPALPNLIPNPTGLYGAWGWRTKAAGATLTQTTPAGSGLRFTRGSGSSTVSTDFMEVVSGKYARGRIERVGGTAGVGYTASIVFYNSAFAALAQSSFTAAQTTNGTLDVPAFLAPANTKYARLIVAHSGSTAGQFVDFTNVCLVSGTVGEVAVTPTVEPAWVDLLSPATEIKITREELNVGTLEAVIRDSALDPAATAVIRKGKIVRLMALNNSTGLYEHVFRGKADVADVTYDLLYPTASKRPRIALVVVDPNSILASTPRPNSVDTIANLPEVLDMAGVPWNVNGSTAPVGDVFGVAVSSNATALDQVAMTRDTVRGYAWMSRLGVLNAWDRATISATVAATLDEDDYVDLQLGYSTDDLLNSVSVIVRRADPVTLDTVETRYGPYVDEISMRERGRYHQDFTVTANWTDTNAATYAAALLATNPYPRVRVKSLRLPVMTAGHITPARALLDLYDKVTVNNTAAGIAQDLRVSTITHMISPKKWTIDIGFTEIGGVAAPQAIPPLPTDNIVGASVNVAGESGWISATKVWKRHDVVTVRVDLTRDGSSGTGAANTSAAIIPVGYRPREGMYANGSDAGSGGVRPLYIATDGGIKFVFGVAAGAGTWAYFTYVM